MEIGAPVSVKVDEMLLGPSSVNEVGLDEVMIDEDVVVDSRIPDDMTVDENVDVELVDDDDDDDGGGGDDDNVIKELCADTEMDQPRR